MSDYFIYNDFNDLDFLFEPKSIDIIADITKRRFKEDLLFAIIETVTISRVKGIGTTQYLAYKSIDFIEKTIHKDYLDIIKEIDDTPMGSLNQYYDWYKLDQFYYVIGENRNANPKVRTILNSHTIDPEPKPESNEYIKKYDKVLTDGEIRKFFDDYTQCLLTKDWFKELPHYFILVKPISIKDKQTQLYIPLGNLYLKIGTRQKIDINECRKYVNSLKSIWFNKYGDIVLKEYSQKIISDEFKPKISKSQTLKNKFNKPLFTIDGKEITLNDFFYYTFDLDVYSNLKHGYLHSIKTNFIQQLIRYYNDKEEIKHEIKSSYGDKNDKNDPMNILNKTVNGLKNLDKPSIEYFLLLLSKRRLALALLLIFGFTLEEVHATLAYGERSDKDLSKSKKYHTDYFTNNLFITHSDLPKNFIPLLADREVEFLKKILDQILKKDPKYTCKFNG